MELCPGCYSVDAASQKDPDFLWRTEAFGHSHLPNGVAHTKDLVGESARYLFGPSEQLPLEPGGGQQRQSMDVIDANRHPGEPSADHAEQSSLGGMGLDDLRSGQAASA